MKNKNLVATGTLALCALVAGCGGGQQAETPNVTTYNLEAAFAYALANGVSFAWMQPDTTGESIAVSYEPSVDFQQQFPSSQTLRQTEKWLVTRGGPVSVSYIRYLLSPIRILEDQDTQGNSRTFHHFEDSIPASARIGDTGVYAHADRWIPNQSVAVQERVEWSLEPNTDATAWACLAFIPEDSSISFEEKECLQVDRAGNIYGYKLATTTGGQTVTYQANQVATSAGGTGYINLAATWTPHVGALFSVLRDGADWNRARESGFAALPAEPPVDLTRYMIVFLALGTQPDACWRAELASVTDWPDRTTLRYRRTHTEEVCAPVVGATGLLVALPISEKPLQLIEVP